MIELFAENCKNFLLPLKDGEIFFYPGFLQERLSLEYLHVLIEQLPWQQDEINLFGKKYLQPRLTALFADHGRTYTYSGITMHPKPFPPVLLELKKKIEDKTGIVFTTCLANFYRDGRDSMGWHADDEKELGPEPIIASLSLGAERMFHLRHRKEKQLRYKLKLNSGSLLLMKGQTQHFWQHQVPKTSRPTGPRVNLTFRRI